MGLFGKSLEQHMQEQQRQREDAAKKTSRVNNAAPRVSPPVANTADNAKTHGVAAVQSTNQYSLFKTVHSNRRLDTSHVKKLMAAIEKKNLLHLNPIVVNGNMEVIDGQHRLQAAKMLQLPVYYMVDRNINHGDISSLNSNKKNWKMMDYVNFFAKEGRKDFQQFLELCEIYPEFNPSWMQSLCSKNGTRLGTTIKNGDIDISNIGNARIWVGYLKDFARFIPTVYSTRFIEGSVAFFTSVQYDHPKMLEAIAANLDIIEPKALSSDYTKMLKKIFNKAA